MFSAFAKMFFVTSEETPKETIDDILVGEDLDLYMKIKKELERESFRGKGLTIIQEKIQQLIQITKKYKESEQLRSMLHNELSACSQKHSFIKDCLIQLENNNSITQDASPKTEKSSHLDQLSIKLLQIHKIFQEEDEYELDNAVEDLKSMIEENSDRVFEIITRHKIVLQKHGLYDQLSNILIFQYSEAGIECKNKDLIQLLKQIDTTDDLDSKKKKIWALKMQFFGQYFKWAILRGITDDFVIQPERIVQETSKINKLFQINEKYELNLLTNVTMKMSKDEQGDLIKIWAQKITDVDSFSMLLPVFFHLIKRCETWDSFVSQINQQLINGPYTSHLKITQLNTKFFFTLLYIQSDTILQIRLLQMFSLFNPVPLLYQQSVDETISYVLNDKIYYCIDNSKGIFSFALGQLASYPCGKSSFLNSWFKTQFPTNDNLPQSFGTVDIHFDHSFVPSRQICIADGHGSIQDKYLECLTDYFEVLIIHMHHIDLRQSSLPQNLIKIFDLIKNNNPKKQIFLMIRDCEEILFQEDCILDKEVIIKWYALLSPYLNSPQIHMFCLKQLNQKNEQNIVSTLICLRQSLFQVIFDDIIQQERTNDLAIQKEASDETISNQNEHYEPQQQLKEEQTDSNDSQQQKDENFDQDYDQLFDDINMNITPQSFAKFLESVDSNNDIVTVNKYVNNFVSSLLSFSNNFFDEKAFPTRDLMKILRNCDNTLRNTSLTENKLCSAEQKQLETKQILQQIQPTNIIEQFIEILSLGEQAMVATIELSKMIKLIISKKVQHLYVKKQMIYRFNKKEEQDEKINAMIDIISSKIEKQSLSIEHIWRELLYMFAYNKGAFIKYKITPTESVREFINAGEPFEVIDGDNLFFQKDILMNILSSSKLAKSRILVISVLGPQSSGKSTLLNYMFGCLFATSTGRCTKGIYGSILQLTNNPDYDLIFIIDSEGLQSAEKGDTEFDRKIACFILSVSHIVLINVKGDLHLPMQNLLEICTLSLHELNKAKLDLPQIYFVFNQNPDLDKTKFFDQIGNIMNNIIKANPEAKTTASMLKPDSDKIIPLPLAFKSEKIEKSNADGTPRDWYFNEPSNNFSSECSKFADQVLKLVAKCNRSDKPLSSKTFQEWLDGAQIIWEIINKYPDLVIYCDIKAMQQDKKMKCKMDELQNFYLISKEQQHKEYLVNIFQNKKNEMDRLPQIVVGAWDMLQKGLEREIYIYFDHLKLEMINEFDNYNNIENFDPQLYKKNKFFIENRVESYQQESTLEIRRLVKGLCFDKTSKTGLYDLRMQLIKMIENIQEGQDLDASFNIIWQNFINQQFKDIELDKNNLEIFQTLVALYRNKYPGIPIDYAIQQHLGQLSKNYDLNYNVNVLYSIPVSNLVTYFAEKMKINIDFYQSTRLPRFYQVPKNFQKGRHTYIEAKDYLEQRFEIQVYDIEHLFLKNGLKFIQIFSEKIQKEIHKIQSKLGYIPSEKSKKEAKETLKDSINTIFQEISSLGVEPSIQLKNRVFDLVTFNSISNYTYNNSIIAKMTEYLRNIELDIKNENTIFQYFEINKHNVNVEELRLIENRIFEWTKDNDNQKQIIKILYFESKQKTEEVQEQIKISNSQISSKYKVVYVPKKQFLSLEDVFKWIQQPTGPQMSGLKIIQRQSMEFCVGHTNWHQYFQDIAEELEKGIKGNTNLLDENWRNIFSLCVAVIDNVINKVTVLLDNLSYELSQFAVSLQREAETHIHFFALYIIFKSIGYASMKRLQEPLEKLNQRKDEWYGIFMSLAANNPVGLSNALAHGLCQKSFEIIEKEMNESIKTKAFIQLKNQSSQFTVKKFIAEMDTYYFSNSQDIDEIMGYVLDANTCFETNFEKLWTQQYILVDNIIIEEKNKAIQIIESSIDFFKSFQKFLIDLELYNFEATELFEGTLPFEKEIDLRQEAAFQFLYDVCRKCVTDQWQYHSENKNIIKLTKKNLAYICNSFTKVMPEAIIIALLTLENKRLGQFKALSETFIQKMTDYTKQIQSTKITIVDIGADTLYNEYKKLSIGCVKICPCCGRKCEQDSSDHPNKHEIFFGHQIQGMKGIRYEGSNVALYESCDERKPDAECKLEGQKMNWSVYAKKYLPDWQFNFGQDSKNIALHLEKYRKLWKNHGDRICHFFKTKYDIPLEFRLNNVSSASQKHFILILDDSGSMTGIRWSQAQKGAQNFLQSGQSYFSSDNVSLMQFGSDAVIKCENQPINPVLANKLVFRGGGTQYGPPLQQSIYLMKKYQSICDIFIIIFYTDGGASYPTHEVSQITSSGLPFKFFAICEGSAPASLTQMASSLGGKLTAQVKPEDLSTHLVAVLNSFNKQ